MSKQELIDKTVDILEQLPEEKIKEINEFADFILKRLDDKTLQEGIYHMLKEGKPYQFLEKEEDIYRVEDLKERYK
ncbi:hypothetical protein SAMN04489724_0902 [Algoriphagus locisalis]|uniref:DUF2281 domain-containing protein n=1 Tax=Algoriphagus locisalis TaxID=305507 RepID=A0A1I6YAG2_9BACT|nr:hypothetical protein [Algoriphagus locisalis]SFT47412.1 hypothetical protein SAMN04489724_0902 [Algoriphagus locisalis]